MTNFGQTNQTGISTTVEDISNPSGSSVLFPLKIVEYLFLAAFICAIVISYTLPEIQIAKIYTAAFLSIWLFVFLIDKNLFNNSRLAATQSKFAKRAEIYHYLSVNNNPLENNPLTPARANALQYSQELIDDYKNIRSSSRNIYYTLQLATVIFSGITPILVLVDKLEIGISWFKWLPVIFPAVASIVASIVTSFPFQENSVSANTTVELLEAEQEKFILGVTEDYRNYDVEDATQSQQKAKQAIENFIVRVNNIHLNQVQGSAQAKSKDQKTEPVQSAESPKLTQEQS